MGVVVLAALAGCGDGRDDSGRRATGTVHGLIVMVGGPSSASREAVGETATALRGTESAAQQRSRPAMSSPSG